jgi:hypothetical protein
MDTNRLIEQAEQRLTELIAEQDELSERLQASRTEALELVTEINKLNDLMNRFHPDSGPSPSTEPTPDSWANLTLAGAVVSALRYVSTPVGPTNIQTILKQHGKEADTPNISATLDYLKRKNLVANVGRAQWQVVPTAPDLSAEMATLMSGGPHPENNSIEAYEQAAARAAGEVAPGQ